MGNEIKYELIRSARSRGASIRVLPDDRIVVRAGKRASGKWIEQVVNGREKWIARSLERNASLKAQYRPQGITSGAIFPYLGRDRMLAIESGRYCVAEPENDHISLFFRKKFPEEKEILKKLAEWYKVRAREYFSEKVEIFSSRVGKSPAAVRIKGQGGRWGSCSSRGNLNLNWKLMLAPSEVIDYVIAHEVCHLIHPNHSPRFWALVREIYPAADRERKWLVREGSRLMWIAWPLSFS